jgi:hypothetical protein
MNKYPVIDKIRVVMGDYYDWEIKKPYNVFIGISPDNMPKIDPRITDEVKQYSNYILNSKNEKLGKIIYFNPKEWEWE